MSLNVVIHWFRTDLRLGDNPALHAACASAGRVLPVYCHDPAEDAATPWGFVRRGRHRRAFLAAALDDLDAQLRAQGSRLLQLRGVPAEVLPALARAIGADTVVCEEIAAPEELDAVAALRAAGLTVRMVWQSSLLDPAALPFAVERLPKVFTDFRRAAEAAGQQPPPPLTAPAVLPPLPDLVALPPAWLLGADEKSSTTVATIGASSSSAAKVTDIAAARADRTPNASFPWWLPDFAGGERAARAHVARYFGGDAAQRYKATRNGLTGIDFSSKFSPWLAQGALSAREVFAALRRHEAERGANESTYWLWFELLWRDYFRFLHLQHGRRLYRARGLNERALPPTHDPEAFERWCAGRTGHPFIDAGMRELAATGWLSNRMRQIVASYLIHDLGCDWRAGAAWLEAQLVDYDVYSNQGNWLYIAGRGTDPRGGRRFDPDKQAATYDPDGAYRALWAELELRPGA
jgi:deoxyribodipyrimidine photo-lyase